MLDLRDGLQYATEAVKLIGALASFYTLLKLRQIEKKYLFKATVPELVSKVESALSILNLAIHNPSRHRTQITEALNYLIVDVKNIKRKSRGDSLQACNELLKVVQATRPGRYFWQAQMPMVIGKSLLLDIYGKGHGLIRALENDMRDHGWSGK